MSDATFEDVLLTCGRGSVAPERARLVPSELLAALRRTGTAHVYADTADTEELRRVLTVDGNGLVAEVDGNTVNQPLARQVLERYLAGDRLAACAQKLRPHRRDASGAALLPYVYTMVSGWIGHDLVNAFAAGRPWEVSLQLHMGALSDPETAKALGRALRTLVPSGFVKIPFRPHEPQSLLIARDLEAEGIPVNFTSTFSARQVVAAALLCDVTRSNIFMGRLNQGFHAGLLGEHVDLEAQRALRRLRREAGVKTQLIVASIREWQTFLRVAGCDVFTAPCKVLGEFLAQTDVPPEALTSRLETSYEDRLGIADDTLRAVGQERIARLWQVEPDFLTPKLGALHFYQLAIPAPAPPPGSFDAAAATRGDALFTGKAGCARCHVPPLYTEPGWNMHAAAEIGIDDLQARRAPDERYRTAPLRGLWTHQKGGFYHDGRFATLRDVVAHYDGFFGLGLTSAEIGDLIEFLKSL